MGLFRHAMAESSIHGPPGDARQNTSVSFPRKRESILTFKGQMDSRFRGNEGLASGHKSMAAVLTSPINQHRIAITKKPIAFLNRERIGSANVFNAAKRRYQHQQR